MALRKLFRRCSSSNLSHANQYNCKRESSIAETLFDELELQCQQSLESKSKRHSTLYEQSRDLIASTYESSAKRHSSVDYSWLNLQNQLPSTQSRTYQLPDMIKIELNELIRNISPQDCTRIVHNFRRHVRSQLKTKTPENIIASFREILASYINENPKMKHHSHSDEQLKDTEEHHTQLQGKNIFFKINRISPQSTCDEKQNSNNELNQISLGPSSISSAHFLIDHKPRSNTCT